MSSWEVHPQDDGTYTWNVEVDGNTGEGTNPTEPDALRDIADALDWLQGITNLASLDRPRVRSNCENK